MAKKKRLPGDVYVRDMERIVALGLVLGYLDVGVIELSRGEFTFTLRGPLFWRLTSGLPPYLHRPSTGPAADAYLRLEALLAYLLFSGEAYVSDATATASAMVWTISSKWFKWRRVQRLLADNEGTFRYRRAILMLLNLAIGIGLMVRELPFVITAVSFHKNLTMRFITSAAPLQRSRRRLPSKLTLPLMNGKLHLISVMIGFLLLIQQARIDGFLVERGGLLGFSIAADVFAFKVIPRILQEFMHRE